MSKTNSISARIILAAGVLVLCALALGCQQKMADATVLGQAAKSVMLNSVEIYNTGNTNLVEAVISPNYIGHVSSLSEPVIGRQGYIDWVQVNRTAFSDFSVVATNLIAENNLVALQWTVTGVNDGMMRDMQPTGKRVNVKGLTLARVEDGKIVEEWITWDLLDMYRQLGVEPPATTM